METLFDGGLVALETITPGKGTYCSTLRCRTFPSEENSQQLRSLATDFSLARIVSSQPRGVAGTSCNRFEYLFYLIWGSLPPLQGGLKTALNSFKYHLVKLVQHSHPSPASLGGSFCCVVDFNSACFFAAVMLREQFQIKGGIASGIFKLIDFFAFLNL